jgi:hypothetical protein
MHAPLAADRETVGRTKTSTMSQTCLECGLLNPDHAAQCDCGYRFGIDTPGVRASLFKRSARLLVGTRDNRFLTGACIGLFILIAAFIPGLGWLVFPGMIPASAFGGAHDVAFGVMTFIFNWIIYGLLTWWFLEARHRRGHAED